jgi:hypothetical protein
MSKHDYLACDGGPHLVLPAELASQWNGGSLLGVGGDYARACAAVNTKERGVVSVGTGKALVMRHPGLSSWGTSGEGWVDIYDIGLVKDTDLDALIDRAIAAVPTSAMVNTGESLGLLSPDLFLLFAGDTTTSTAYGVYRIPLAAGSYTILQGRYGIPGTEQVVIYRLQPVP